MCFVDNYGDAIEYVTNRRVRDPAIYNAKRLAEHPLPNLTIDETSQSDVDSAADVTRDLNDLSIQGVHTSNENFDALVNSPIQISIENDDGHNDENRRGALTQAESSNQSHNLIDLGHASNASGTNVAEFENANMTHTEHVGNFESEDEDQISILNDFDPLMANSGSDNHSSDNGLHDIACSGFGENVASAQGELVMKIEPIIPVQDVLNQLINDPEYIVETVDEDMEIIIDSKMGFEKPYSATENGLIKRESDVISGPTPFDKMVS